jgi:hypothetical protein
MNVTSNVFNLLKKKSLLQIMKDHSDELNEKRKYIKEGDIIENFGLGLGENNIAIALAYFIIVILYTYGIFFIILSYPNLDKWAFILIMFLLISSVLATLFSNAFIGIVLMITAIIITFMGNKKIKTLTLKSNSLNFRLK